jgi:hypothetical protein
VYIVVGSFASDLAALAVSIVYNGVYIVFVVTRSWCSLTGYGDTVAPVAYNPPAWRRGTSLAAFRKALSCSAFIFDGRCGCRN